MARTFPTVGVSPCDFYSAACDRPLGYFEWDIPSTVTTALDGCVYIKVADGSATTSGYQRGLYINYTSDGAKTSSAEVNALGIDMTVSAALPYAYMQSLYFVTSGNPTIGLVSPMTIYVDDLGTACASFHMLDLQYGSTNAATTRGTYFRIRNHADNTPTSVFYIQANNNASAATYFIDQDNVTTGPVAAAVTASADAATFKVACRKGSTVFYLYGVAAS